MSKLKKRFLRMKTCEYWTICYRKRVEGAALYHEKVIEGFQILKQSKFVTQADPFLFKHQGMNYLFYEKQNLTDMKGTLWCQNLDRPEEKPVPVLEEKFHLSYPQVFRYGKYTYMVPETRNAGEIRLYKCESFPGKWTKVRTLFDLSAVDTTFLMNEKSEEETFAFTYTNHQLQIYACHLESDKFDLKASKLIYTSTPSETVRPGGNFIKEGTTWYRPAQNCTDSYGEELIIYEITELSEHGFSEKEYCRLKPEQVEIRGICPVGIHTYNQNDDFEVIDVLHREIGFGVLLKKINWKIRNLLHG